MLNIDSKKKIEEFNNWNLGDKKLNSTPIVQDPPSYLTDFINFMKDLPNLNKRDDRDSTISLTQGPEGNKVKESISNLDISDDKKNYLLTLSQRESGMNPTIVGKTGTYKGLYQFGPAALNEVGITENQYMGNIYAQHEAALRLRDRNLNKLNAYRDYIGTIYRGIPITENGIAAAAHLLGAGGVKAFFDHGEVRKDGLGTPITEYFKLFT